MENNEDNRRMTTIVELIEQRKKSLVYWNGLICDADYSEEIEYAKGQRDQVIKTIKDLERLLPKEEQSHIDFAAAYKTAVHYDPMIKSPRTVYHETFKPYTNEADPHK